MHYSGMAALRMPARIYYEPWLFALSVLVAVVLSALALFVLLSLQKLRQRWVLPGRVAGALVMGLAIVLMHFTGMLATYVLPNSDLQQSGILFDPPLMATAVAIVSFLIVGLALAAAWFEQRIVNAETLLRDAIESFPEGFIVYDENNRLFLCNQAYRRMYAGSADVLVPGTHYHDIARRGPLQPSNNREDKSAKTVPPPRDDAAASVERQLSDGTWVLASDRRMTNGATAGLRVDISKLKAVQDALRSSEQRLDAALNNLTQGVCFFDGASHLILATEDTRKFMLSPLISSVRALRLRP